MDKFIKIDGVSFNATNAAQKTADQFAKEHDHNFAGNEKQKAKQAAAVHAKLVKEAKGEAKEADTETPAE